MSKQYIVEIKVEDGQAKTKLNSLNKDLSTTSKQATKTGAALNDSFGLLPSNVQLAITRVRSLNVSLKALAVGGIVAGIGAVGSLFAAAARKGAEFDKAMSGVKAVTNATEEQMNALASTAKRLGSTTEFTAMQVAELETELAKLGFPVSDIVEMSEATLNLASSMGIGLGEAAAFTGSTLRAFGLEATESKKVIDILAQSTASSALDFGKLNTALTTVAPIAKTAKVSLSDTTAMLGTLANAGFDASTSGTALRNIFLTLSKEGITMEEAFAKINSATDKNRVALELFDKRGAGVAITLAENTAATADLKLELDGASEAFDGLGAAAGIAETRLDNLAGDTTKLNSAWEGFLLSIEDGDGILNRIARTFTQELTASIERFRKGLAAVTAIFDELGASFNVFGRIGDQFKKTTLLFQAGATNIKLALSGIPFIGDSFDRTALQQELQEYRKAFLQLELRTQAQNKIRETRNKQGTFWERVSARIAKAEEGYALALEKSNKAGKENNEIIEDAIENEEQLTGLIEIQQQKIKELEEAKKKATSKEIIEAKEKEIQLAKTELQFLLDIGKQRDLLRTREIQQIDTHNKMREEKERSFLFTMGELAKKDAEDKRKGLQDDIQITLARQTLQNQLVGHLSNSLQQVAQLAGEGTKVAKAAALADIIMKTGVGFAQGLDIAQKTAAGTGPAAAFAFPIFYASQVAAVLSAVGQAKNILSKVKGPSANIPTTGPEAGAPPTQPTAPQFNIVGQSGINQVAQALGQQQPVQAYVVAQDVTTAQQLNNNIISAATVGG